MKSLLRRGLGSFAVLLGGAVVLSSGCTATPKGSLMLSISTDMQTPKDVDVVSLFIATDGVVKFDYLGRVLPDGSLSLPSTLALVQPDNPDAQVHVRVVGFQTQGQQENARVLRDVVTTVPSLVTSLLRLPLDFIDDGSGQGTLPAQYVPDGVDSAPEGVTQFLPSVIASSCDPMNLCNTPGGSCKTMVNGVCGSATVDSSTLPTYAQSDVFGDGGFMPSGAPETCFDVPTCFGNAVPVATVSGQGTPTCSFPLPSGMAPATLNVALVTPSTGACLATGCYVPLPNDADEGWTVQGGTVMLAPGICAKLGDTMTLAVSSVSCVSETLSEPVCEPTTPAEVAEAGTPPVRDAGPADVAIPDSGSATPDTGSACAGNFVITCAASSTCGGGYAALTVSGTQTTLYVEENADDGGGQTVPYEGTVDLTSCIATFVFPAPEVGSCGGPLGTVTATLLTGASFTVGCSSGSQDGSCALGTLSCTAAQGTLDGGPSNGNEAAATTPDATIVAQVDAAAPTTDGSTAPEVDAGSETQCTPGQSLCVGNGIESCQTDGTWGAPTQCTTMIPNATSGCVSGVCTSACAGGFSNCSGACVNQQTDGNNCGLCGFVCQTGYSCVNGTCSATTGCTSDSQCSGATPYCDTPIATCVQCLVEPDCTGATPYCVGNVCSANPPGGGDAGVLPDASAMPDVMTATIDGATVDGGGCVEPPSGIVARWDFDGNLTDSVGGNDGTAYGTIAYVPGQVGQAIDFTGASYVMANAVNLPTGTSDRTVELWGQFQGYYPNWSDAAAPADGLFFGYGSWGTVDGTNMLVVGGFDNLDDTLSFSQWGASLTQPASSAPGTWYHIATTLASGTLTVYVNGNPVALSSSIEVNTPGDALVYLGGFPNPPDGKPEYLTGYVDAVAVYDRALAPAEIVSIYQAGSAGKCP
jgi:hypothetical protein